MISEIKIKKRRLYMIFINKLLVVYVSRNYCTIFDGSTKMPNDYPLRLKKIADNNN